jgi:ABC-type sugar transport system ATPase subunit
MGISERILEMHQGSVAKESQRGEFDEENTLRNAFRGQ